MATPPTYHHYGKVTNGSLVHYNWPLFKQSLASLEGKEFDLIVKEKRKRVSLDTHGYYRGGIIRECLQYEIFGGWEEEDVHDFFSFEFLGHTKTFMVRHDNGMISYRNLKKVPSTADLSQKEMNEYIEKVIAWLANEGIVVHSPEDYYLGKYKTIEK